MKFALIEVLITRSIFAPQMYKNAMAQNLELTDYAMNGGGTILQVTMQYAVSLAGIHTTTMPPTLFPSRKLSTQVTSQ